MAVQYLVDAHWVALPWVFSWETAFLYSGAVCWISQHRQSNSIFITHDPGQFQMKQCGSWKTFCLEVLSKLHYFCVLPGTYPGVRGWSIHSSEHWFFPLGKHLGYVTQTASAPVTAWFNHFHSFSSLQAKLLHTLSMLVPVNELLQEPSLLKSNSLSHSLAGCLSQFAKLKAS